MDGGVGTNGGEYAQPKNAYLQDTTSIPGDTPGFEVSGAAGGVIRNHLFHFGSTTFNFFIG